MHPLPRSEPAHSPAGPSAGLIQCERTLCVRRGQVAEHGRTPAVAARMPPAVLLLIHLRIGTAAGCCCCSSSSLLLPHSVKPAAQRGVQNSRGFGYLLRLSAFRPGDRSWMVRWSSLSSIEPSIDGRTVERDVVSGEIGTARPKKHGSDDCHKMSDLAHAQGWTHTHTHQTQRSHLATLSARLARA